MRTRRYGGFLAGAAALAAVAAYAAWGITGSAVALWLPPTTLLDAEAAAQPRLKIDQTARNVGVVMQGGPLRTAFSVQNAGGKRLILMEKTSRCCGGDIGRQVIVAPRSSDAIELEVDTSRCAGRFEEKFLFTTNDPGHPILKLSVLGIARTNLDGA